MIDPPDDELQQAEVKGKRTIGMALGVMVLIAIGLTALAVWAIYEFTSSTSFP